MKILITGASGFLGTKLINILSNEFEIIKTDINAGNDFLHLDITNKENVFQVLNEQKPNVVIHTAAFTNVDACEDNRDAAHLVNVIGTKNLAQACKQINAKLIHISTDFIFDGKKGNYSEDDEPNPISYYGQTKLDAEYVVKENCHDYIIARGCVLYGTNGENDKTSFVHWVIDKLSSDAKLKIVTDQIVTPTLIDDIAHALSELIKKNANGVFHLTGSEAISRFDMAKKIQKVFGLEGEIIPFNSGELKQKAQRPMNSSLKIDKLNYLGIQMSNVEEGLKRMREQMKAPLKGLILSGGLGTRLRPLTFSRQKQLLPIADKDLIFYAIEDLVNSGIRNIGIVVGPNKEQIIQEVGKGDKWGINIAYIDQPEPKGLAHAVLVSKDFLQNDKFVMYLGDNLFSTGIEKFVNSFMYARPDANILLTKVNNPKQFGIADVDENFHIKRLMEKPENPPTNLAIVGVYAFNNKIFHAIENIEPSSRGELEITDAIEWLIEHNYRVKSGLVKGWWEDAGNPEDMLEANRLVLDKINLQNQGVIEEGAKVEGKVGIFEGTFIRKDVLIKGPVIIGKNCEITKGYIGPYTSIGSNVKINNINIENSIILNDCVIDTEKTISKSIIGENSIITDSKDKDELLVGDKSIIKL